MHLRLYIFVFVILFPVNFIYSQSIYDSPQISAAKYYPGLQSIVKIHEEIKDLYPALEKLYPIAVTFKDSILIYDLDSDSGYKFIKEGSLGFPAPNNIKAAMPLTDYDFKPVCVVSENTFYSMKDLILVFHEFVHCYQYYTVEMKLKQNLDIYNEAINKKDYMWELNYQFPYENKKVDSAITNYLNALEKMDSVKIYSSRNALKKLLSKNEFEYLRWQEWKEGYARYIENILNVKYNLTINNNGRIPEYNRVLFYYSGSKYIGFLNSKHPGIDKDIEKLYYAME